MKWQIGNVTVTKIIELETTGGSRFILPQATREAVIFERGLADLVEWDHQICPEIRLMPSRGHTPGHASIVINSKGQRSMITGDFAHHPCQMAHPEWSSTADYDPAAAEATRRRIFGDLAGEPVLVIGTHFASPTAGHVARDGKTFKLVV